MCLISSVTPIRYYSFPSPTYLTLLVDNYNFEWCHRLRDTPLNSFGSNTPSLISRESAANWQMFCRYGTGVSTYWWLSYNYSSCCYTQAMKGKTRTMRMLYQITVMTMMMRSHIILKTYLLVGTVNQYRTGFTSYTGWTCTILVRSVVIRHTEVRRHFSDTLRWDFFNYGSLIPL